MIIRAGSGISGSRVPENFSGTRTQNWVRVPENIALWVVSIINQTCKRWVFKWVAGGKKFSDMQIQCCYTEKLFKLRISWISIVGRCLVSTSRGLLLDRLRWYCFGSGIGSGRVLSSGIRVSNYPTRPSPSQLAKFHICPQISAMKSIN